MADGLYRGLCGPEDFRAKPKPQDDFGFKNDAVGVRQKAERFATDELVEQIAHRKWYPIRHGDKKWSVRWSSHNGSFVELAHVVGRPWFKLEASRKTPPSRA